MCETQKTNWRRIGEVDNWTVFVPEQLRALAFVALEDLESGRNFISGCLDLKASLAVREFKKKTVNMLLDV